MAGLIATGHRHRGAGISLENQEAYERALVLARHKGTTRYVDSNAAAGGSGDSWASAYTTLQAAITAAIAGDTILVADGHTETLASAAAVAVSKALTIVGIGVGRRRPTFTFATLTTATMTIAGSNVLIANCVFVCAIDAQVTMLLVTGSDVTLMNCEFDFAPSSTVQASLGITVGVATTGGVDRFKMYGCTAHGTLNAGTTNFVQIVGVATFQNDFEFIGNTFIGAFTTTLGAINNITVAMVNMIVRDNVFVNSTASATKCIVTLTGSTGLVMRNAFGIGSGAAPITMDAGWWAGNWSAAAVQANGTLV